MRQKKVPCGMNIIMIVSDSGHQYLGQEIRRDSWDSQDSQDSWDSQDSRDSWDSCIVLCVLFPFNNWQKTAWCYPDIEHSMCF